MPADLAALANGKSVVIDNTNPDPATRKRYIDLAKKSKKPVRCVWVSTPRELAQHLNLVRNIANTSENPIGKERTQRRRARMPVFAREGAAGVSCCVDASITSFCSSRATRGDLGLQARADLGGTTAFLTGKVGADVGVGEGGRLQRRLKRTCVDALCVVAPLAQSQI